ncbi:MAG: phosphate acyltransferase PlsX [Oscillospiraceae bacterium]
MLNIIVDAMGGDNAPKEPIRGAVNATKNLGVTITLVGKEDQIRKELETLEYDESKIVIVNATEVITGEDDPTVAIRQKKDSSLRVALLLLHRNQGDALVSAGNTGALIAGATLIVKRIKGIRRVALAPIMPTSIGCFLLVDAGANAECTPAFLKQFAIMGSIYMEKIMGIKKPRIGLVNIGSEEDKGTPLVNEAHKLLQQTPINYTGYIESREIPQGGADVVVCDGFTGNVILKFMEGMGMTFAHMLKGIFFKNMLTKLAALMVKKGIKELKSTMDYTEYGGAPILGASMPVIKAHGSSNAKAFFHAIRQAKEVAQNGLIEEITENIQKYGDVPQERGL